MGMTQTITGDTLVGNSTSAANAAANAQKHLSASALSSNKGVHSTKEQQLPQEEQDILLSSTDQLVLAGIETPDPVFSCTIEPPSLRLMNKFNEALAELEREDPSMRVTFDPESQQQILMGMGELHIEIIKDRLKTEYGLDVFLGPIMVNYKESISHPAMGTGTIDETLQDRHQYVTITVSLTRQLSNFVFKHIQVASHHGGSDSLVNHMSPSLRAAIEEGVLSALRSGPISGYPIVGVDVVLMHVEKQRATNPVVSAAATQAVHNAMKHGEPVLLEPMGRLDLLAEKAHTHAIIQDLAERKAEILSVSASDNLEDLPVSTSILPSEGTERILANVPLRRTSDLATRIRQLSSGLASYHLEPSGYRVMSEAEKQELLQQF